MTDYPTGDGMSAVNPEGLPDPRGWARDWAIDGLTEKEGDDFMAAVSGNPEVNVVAEMYDRAKTERNDLRERLRLLRRELEILRTGWARLDWPEEGVIPVVKLSELEDILTETFGSLMTDEEFKEAIMENRG